MKNFAPMVHRALKNEREKFHSGVVLSFTTLAHPPVRFGHKPRTVALIELSNGKRVAAALVSDNAFIGQAVRPRMRLSHVTEEGLRVYETAYEAVSNTAKPRVMIPRYILALTGPSGVGKSTISKLLTRVHGEYTANVPIITTRGERGGDDGEYLYVSEKEFDRMKHSGEIVALTRIPSEYEDRQYGYRGADIETIWNHGKLPIVVTERQLLEDLAEYFGRNAVLSFGLLPPGKTKRAKLSQLLYRLRARGRDTEETIRERLKNAERDLDFFEKRKDLFDHIEVNEDLSAIAASLEAKLRLFLPA